MSSISEMTPLISPLQNFLISHLGQRRLAAGVSGVTALALLALRSVEADSWQNIPAAAVCTTLGAGLATQLSLEIILDDKEAATWRALIGRYSFAVSIILGNFEGNPLTSFSEEDERIWRYAWRAAYDMNVGIHVIARIMSVIRKKLVNEPMSATISDFQRVAPSLALESSLIKTQVVKGLIAVTLIIFSEVDTKTDPLLRNFGWLLLGHLVGITALGKGVSCLMKRLEEKETCHEFEDLTASKWDTLRVIQVAKKILSEISAPSIGALFLLMAVEDNAMKVRIFNFLIGVLIGYQKWEAEQSMSKTLAHLSLDSSPNVLKTGHVYSLTILAAIMLGWFTYALHETSDNTNDVAVLSTFVGSSFLSFFLTVLIDEKIDGRTNSSWLTSIKFYSTIVKVFPLLFLFFTQESNLDLNSEAVERSESTVLSFEIVAWTFFGLALGNQVGQRDLAFAIPDYVVAVYAASIASQIHN